MDLISEVILKNKAEQKIDELSNALLESFKEGYKILDEEFHLKETFENGSKYNDCKIAFNTVAKKLIQVKPELKEWLEMNFKEYLDG